MSESDSDYDVSSRVPPPRYDDKEDILLEVMGYKPQDANTKRKMPELLRQRKEKEAERIRLIKEEQERKHKEDIDRRRKAIEQRRLKAIENRKNLLQRTLIPEHILKEEEEKERKQMEEMRRGIESESESESESEYESETESESDYDTESDNENTAKPVAIRGKEYWKTMDDYLWEREGDNVVGEFAGRYVKKDNKIDDSMAEPYTLSF